MQHKDPNDINDPYMLFIKEKSHSKGTSSIAAGTLVGYEVAIPKIKSLSGRDVDICHAETKYNVKQNLAWAIKDRESHIKPGLLPAVPEWVADLPPAPSPPVDMDYVQKYSSPSTKVAEGITKGDHIGWKVAIPKGKSVTGEKIFNCVSFKDPLKSLDENLALAKAWRDARVKR